jgi:hypothetical protein
MHRSGGGLTARLSPEAAPNTTGAIQRIVQCPASLAFTARVYGIAHGAVYLSGRTDEDEESAVSLMVPHSCFARLPDLGEDFPVTVRIGEVEDAYYAAKEEASAERRRAELEGCPTTTVAHLEASDA